MKCFRAIISVLAWFVLSYVHAQFPIVLEAEDAQLFGSLQILNHSGFSKGKYVHEFLVNTDSYYLYDDVEVTKSGTYELRVHTTGSSRPFYIKVNNYERKIHWTKDSPHWNDPPTTTSSTYIYLDAGKNTIKFGSEFENGPNIDKFEIYNTSVSIEKPITVKTAYSYDFTDDAIIEAEHDNETLKFLTDNDESTFYEVAGVNSTQITIDCEENKLVTAMILSAGKGVNVTDWLVEYSANGRSWKTLTPETVRTVGMGDQTLFLYNRTVENMRLYSARYYRLTAKGNGNIKVAEWQLFGSPFLASNQPFPTDITKEADLKTQLSASPVGRTNETYMNLFDRKLNTKYCVDDTRAYVQYILDGSYKINSYSITSASDSPERDPKLWSFSGYNPEEGWIELHEQRGFLFPGRFVTMKFDIDSDKEFTAFMLEVSSVKAGKMMQLSNIQVFGDKINDSAVTPTLPSSVGSPKERAAELVKLMTKSEKLSYVGGTDWMFIRDIPRLNIPRIKMSDGPQGIGTWGKSTAYPATILLASTWNENLAWKYGEGLALDARAKGVNVLLGPGVNIHRAPMCGRNFEYMGEDPYLAARTAVGYIKGVQENGVMAVIKHFTANYQEYDRNYISSDVDERTLNEIYFPAFRAAVEEANVGSIMSSYNLLNGVWTTHDPWLLTTVLRDQWGFEGILMSDWGSTHACLPAANAGLDLEMAGGEHMSPDSLRYYINRGDLDMGVIDQKVQHILQTIIEFGFLENEQLDKSIPENNPYTAEIALNVAREGMVLLKNTDDILPLDSKKTKKVVVVGSNVHRYVTGGGSGRVDPIRFVSFYEGIAAIGAQNGFQVDYLDQFDHMDDVVFTSGRSNENGFVGQYYNNRNLEGSPLTKIDKKIDFNFQNGTGFSEIGTSNYSIRWTGELRPQESGTYTFTLGGDDGFRLYIDESLVIDDWNEGQERYKTYRTRLDAGSKYQIKVEYFQSGGAALVDLYWTKSDVGDYFLTELNSADVVIACFGHDASSEAEGGDRTFALPNAQSEFVNKALKTTTPVIGVVTAGGNVEMQSWEPKLKGLLWSWYPGQEGGTALGEILFGDVNPSGKLPVTFEKRWADNPTYNSYYDSDGDKHVAFTEGVFMGYRGYDKLKRRVQYPFGYGLSYTEFNISDMTVEEVFDGNSIYTVTCQLKNTGSVAGAQVVQLYVGKKGESPVDRPLKELKAFKKVYLEPGETQELSMSLTKDAFSYFDADETSFVVDEGEHEISLGFSSDELILKQEVNVSDKTSAPTVETLKNILIPSVVIAGEVMRFTIGEVEHVYIYDSVGSLKAYFPKTQLIPTTGLGKGIYLACIQNQDKIFNEKFVVK